MRNLEIELERWREAEKSSSSQNTSTSSQAVPASSSSELRNDWRRQLREAFSSAAKADPPLSAASQIPSSESTRVYPPQEPVNPQTSVSSFRVTDFRFYDPSSSSSHGNQTIQDNLPSQSISFSDSNASIASEQRPDVNMTHDALPPPTSAMPHTYSTTPVSPSTLADSCSRQENEAFVYPPPAYPRAQLPQHPPQLPHSQSAPTVNQTSLQHSQPVSTLNAKSEPRGPTRHTRSRSSAHLYHNPTPSSSMNRRRTTIDLPTRSSSQFWNMARPDASLPIRSEAVPKRTQQTRRSPSRADLETHMAIDSDPAHEFAGQDIYRTSSRAELDDCLAIGFGPDYAAEGTGQAQNQILQNISGAAIQAHLPTTASKGAVPKDTEFERCPSRAELEAILATGFGPEDMVQQNQTDPQSTRYLIPVTNPHPIGNWYLSTSITTPIHPQIPVMNQQFAQLSHPSTSHSATRFPVTNQQPVQMGFSSTSNVPAHHQILAMNHRQAQSGHSSTLASTPTIHISNPQPTELSIPSTTFEMAFSPSTTPVPTHTQTVVTHQNPVEPNYPSATGFVPPQIPPLVAPQPLRVGVKRTIIDPYPLQEYEQVPKQVVSFPEDRRWSSDNSLSNWTGTGTEGASGEDRTVPEFAQAGSGGCSTVF
ncbi:hypothetical protein Moror_9558 [Moniliophthora roreri MCA 2997]|uniref:Uncharacterized protein n=1 Tax=Moniliophthora roreri (strain MCA 2997) TaxID=1381753 RepID=V2XF79_MONRO|nr:hypothetical protein Moror_9558 [Moniliophthora roreri MCA 2997]